MCCKPIPDISLPNSDRYRVPEVIPIPNDINSFTVYHSNYGLNLRCAMNTTRCSHILPKIDSLAFDSSSNLRAGNPIL